MPGAEALAPETIWQPLPFSPEPVPVMAGKAFPRIWAIPVAATLLALMALASWRSSMHTIYVVTLVCQATSALILGLLAYTGHRLPGLRALAAACGLHAIAIFVIPMWAPMLERTKHWAPEALSAALMPLFFFLVDEGLRSLIQERKEPPHSRTYSRKVTLLVSAAMLLVASLAPWSQFWSMQVARCVAVVLMARTTNRLWHTRPGATRIPALVTAVLLGCILCTILVRVPLEPRGPVSPAVAFVTKLSIIEITLLAFSFIALQQIESKRILHLETRQDSLTGLPNRRAMEEWATTETRLSERTGRPLALLMIDLDGFKKLNDTYGHSFGDAALRVIGDVLSRNATAGSHVARLSGEEFVMLLPNHTLAAACQAAEMLRAAIADIPLVKGNPHVSLTVSVGVAMRHAGESTWTEMLRRADAAMYRAKQGGRNQVMVCEENRAMVYEGANEWRTSHSIPVETSAL
jgi:diguanylate cyclase (GGDEF)-like protein